MRIFITGATSGLGKALSEAFAAKKLPLFITGSNKKNLEDLEKQLSSISIVTSFKADLAVKEERTALLEHLKSFAPTLAINNAGFGIYGDCLTTSTAEQLRLLAVNAEAVVEITLETARFMKEQSICGTILNISSSTAFFPFPGLNVYAASKGFVKQFSQALDIELSGTGIRILTACPGQIATPFSRLASKGLFNQKSSQAMSIEKAVRIPLWQIEKKKYLYVFDWRYRFSIFISKFLPIAWLA